MISEGFIQAISIQKLLFFYLPRFPLKWNSSCTRLEPNSRPLWRMIPWTTFMLGCFLTGILCGYGAFYFGKINPRPEFQRFNFLCILGAAGLAISVSLLLFEMVRNSPLYVPITNQVFELQEKCSLVYRGRIHHQANPNVDLLLLIGSILFGFTTIFALLNCVLFELDVFYWIFEEYFLTAPEYRSSQEIICSVVIRCVLMYPNFLKEFDPQFLG